MSKTEKIRKYMTSLKVRGKDNQARLLSIFSAAIANCDRVSTRIAIETLRNEKISRRAIYETILQSYLFLGFPRMIEAALVYHEIFGDDPRKEKGIKRYSAGESGIWFNSGKALCRKVYGKNYYLLEKKFLAVSPEIFRWMVIEGYGKVLSRRGLTQIERELAEVAALIVDRRERQLVSHIIGSLNVGAEISLIKQINRDIRPLAGERGFRMAEKIIAMIEKRDETQI
jgi:alkylhydroperoxidase/carboxymuconolactone decarboxylase family protein YurZ